MNEKKNDSRGILHCASTTILSVFLANKNKINSLFNVLNVIFFFYKKLFFSLLLFKIHKKKGYENGQYLVLLQVQNDF